MYQGWKQTCLANLILFDFPQNVESPKWWYKLGTWQKKRWRNQKSKKASPGFLRFFQNSTLMEFPHIICLNNHHFLEHRVTPVLKSPTPKKTPPLKKKRAVLFFLRKPPELRKNSAPNAGYPEWRCWGLTSNYFLKGNRRQNTPARNSWTVWVSCGCFCFKSSRFFSTIFLDPQKRFGFFFRGKSKQLADVRSPGVATMKPSEFHSRSGWRNFKRISTKFSRNSWVSVKKLLG